MNIDAVYGWCMYASSLPLVAIVLILFHYCLRRVLFRRRKHLGKGRRGFYPSAYALGLAFQFMQVFTRPSIAYVLEEKQKQEAEEDDEGDPESLQKQLSRQLRRIRRGEAVDRLVFRM
ncbi:MAG: hypothetical protein ABR987_01775 [Terracidiphilus sp.]|jgi:hypothetical protein